MKCKPTSHRADRAGFTLAEVLAALLFMAIVIPVAVEGMRIAARAGEVGVRKAVATRVGENALNDYVVASQGSISAGNQSGSVRETGVDYQWRIDSEPWTVDQFTRLTVQVDYPVQGQTFNVRLSTLIDPYASQTNSATQ